MPDHHILSLSTCIAAMLVLAISFLLFPAAGSPVPGSGVQAAVTSQPLSPDPFPAGNPAIGDGVLVKNGGGRLMERASGDKTLSSPRPVSPGPGNQTFPQVSGNRVVWMDDRNGSQDIYLYDPVAGTTAIAATSADERYPSISGDLVAYQKESGPENTDIFLYRISTGRTMCITDNPENQEHPSVRGDIVAWEDYRDGVPAIWMSRAGTGKATRISGGAGPASHPRTDGKRVAYEQAGKNGMSYIYVYDITTGAVTGVFPEQEAYTDKTRPSVSGDLVCYQNEYEQGRYSVDIYSLPEGQRVHDRESSARQYNPDISGDVVVWEQRDGSFSKVHVYRISTRMAGMVDPGGRDQTMPSTDGMTVVWQDNRDGRDQVYMTGYASTASRVIPAKTVAPAMTRNATATMTLAGTGAATQAPGRKTVFRTLAPVGLAGKTSGYTRSYNGTWVPTGALIPASVLTSL